MRDLAESDIQPVHPNPSHPHDGIRALIDGELTGDAAARVQSHLADCADCASEHARVAGAVAMLKGQGTIRAPEGFASRVLKRTRSQQRATSRGQWWPRKVPYEGGIIVLLAAAGAAAVLSYGVANRGELVAWLENVAAEESDKEVE